MFKSSIVDVSTVKVLDRYIKSNEQYFLITDEFNLRFKGKIYTINFVISNKIEVGKEIIPTNITMTDFKKIYMKYVNDYDKISGYKNYVSDQKRKAVPKISMPVFDFLEMFFKHFENNLNKQSNKSEDIILFNNPISINAQSSNNRTGYGNEYYYDTLIYEGTKYGETSEFPIVGYTSVINKELIGL